MRLFTLLAGYAAGLAVAMKYRKDNGTSKLDTETPNTSKLNSFIDEVVDIHKTAFADVKSFVNENFDDVDNFDDLKSKVT
jgi:cobalamin biosynthesis protein CbiD